MTNAQRFCNALWEKYGHIWDCEIDHPKYQDTVGDMMRDVINIYRDLPPVKPVKFLGKWLTEKAWDGDEIYKCSVCGAEFVLIDGTPEENGYNFCPTCGADLRGEGGQGGGVNRGGGGGAGGAVGSGT